MRSDRKPRSLSKLLLGLALVTALLWLVAPAHAIIPDPNESALVFNVCTEGCPFASLQLAIDAANAAGMNTPVVVDVSPGVYRQTSSLIIGTFAPGAGNGRIELRGQGQDSVRIVGSSSSGVIKLRNGLTVLRNLTVENTGGGPALDWDTGESLAVVDGTHLMCLNHTSATGCIQWEATAGAANLLIRDSLVEFSNTGVFVFDGGLITSINNRYVASRSLATGQGTMIAVDIRPPATVADSVFYSSGDYIEIQRPNVATAVSIIAGVRILTNSAVMSANMHGLTVRIDDLGTSAAGTTTGIWQGSTTAGSVMSCFDCDVVVNKPNSGGLTSAARADTAAAATLRLIGGRYRATNSDGTDFDLVQVNPAILELSGANYRNNVELSGSISATGGLGSFPALQSTGDSGALHFLNNQGATLGVGLVALSAGWGSTATVTALSGRSGAFGFTVNSTGVGQGLNPTITVTFPDAYTLTTFCQAQHSGSQPLIPDTWTTSSTQVIITFNGTPVAAQSMLYQVICMGQ